MSDSTGRFCWHELMTSDLDGAKKFYSSLFGWGVVDSGLSDMVYAICNVEGDGIAGMMPLPEPLAQQKVPPHWMGYIYADDVDAAAKAVEKDGGTMHRAPADIPNVGRFAVMSDPQGAAFILFSALGNNAQPKPGTPGTFGWNELHANDAAKAMDFYSRHFGWQKDEAIPMGPMGVYQLFNRGGAPIGGMMNKAPEMPRPSWLFYVNVADMNAALERMKVAGGQLLNGPNPVPGGQIVAQCKDPQGAVFAMVGPA